jgi:hypothetical protein
MFLCAAVVLGASCGKDTEMVVEYSPKKSVRSADTDALGGNHADEKFMDGTGVDTNLDIVGLSNEKEINTYDSIVDTANLIGFEVGMTDWEIGSIGAPR